MAIKMLIETPVVHAAVPGFHIGSAADWTFLLMQTAQVVEFLSSLG